MHPLWTSRHLLQLLPQPALPQVSGGRSRPLACSTSPGASPDALCACGLHAASRASATRLAEQEGHLRSPVSHQRGNASGNCTRSKTPRCRDRLLQRSSYLESETPTSPACPLRGAGRWAVLRPLPLDPLTPHVLSSRQSARACFSRQVCGGSQTRLPGWPAGFPRRSATACSTENFLLVAENAIPKRLGSLFETPLRWPTTCTPVSGALYPSRGRLQPPLGFLCGQQSHFPLARLRSPQRTEVAHPIAG